MGKLNIDLMYVDGIQRLIETQSKSIISNSQPENILSLYREFMRHAEEKVLIFEEDPDTEILDDPYLIRCARNAIIHRTVDIELLQGSPKNSRLTALLREYYMPVMRTDPEQSMKGSFKSFILMDDKAYRIDYNGKDPAVASMNCPKIVKKLANIFDYFSSMGSKA